MQPAASWQASQRPSTELVIITYYQCNGTYHRRRPPSTTAASSVLCAGRPPPCRLPSPLRSVTSVAPEPKSESTDPGSATDLADVACTVTDRSDDLALRERGAGSLPRARRALHAPASHPGGTSPRSRARAQCTPKPADRADESRIPAEPVAVDCAASAHADDPALLERGVGRRRSPCERLPHPHATSVTNLFTSTSSPRPARAHARIAIRRVARPRRRSRRCQARCPSPR
jgi:hypothetical protein